MSHEREPVAGDVLYEQLEYYRARAPEYDDWFDRRGRFDRGAAATETWHRELGVVRGWLRAMALDRKDVLELAAGTGLWTAELVAAGASVTAVDAAPEMLAQLQRRPVCHDVSTIQADLYAWRPPRTFDAVVACFFMSHVPDERLDEFLSLVASSIQVGGAVFLLDSERSELSTAVDHQLPHDGAQTMLRRLDDGRSFRVVKRFRTDRELAGACSRHGLSVEVQRTQQYFQVAFGARTN